MTCAVESDAALVARVQGGDAAAFAELVRRYERLARAAVIGTLRDRHAAEDVVQEVFLAAFRSLDSLRQPERFGPWLLGIARNQAMRSLRTLARSERCVAEIAAVERGAIDAGRNGKLSDQSERLLELVERLPDHERVIVGLRYFEGHSMQEIAVIAGRPVGTVTKQLSRAHRRLERWLEEESK